MTSRWIELLDVLAKRDQTLWFLFLLGAALVGGWVLIDYTIPMAWREWSKRIYALTGILLTIVTLVVSR